ncbi:NADP-dependent 3-hydroxy acid dehydrogenase YdfG [Sphaerotilus hippei]|uniref:NADP-dependent 3-hydroxy acid dehydrogenase YdfG n=1 Tax=Sphaerotilus hippei TaxID=744406 RepID=A0A318H617_9BURK|nr:SDR family oxidoreductase [Sphaerotilus hippei]PXW99536.1 NADP-dependent 3-hydroxy acid dehydrogenase YdfG [Sphaerotilus hippei]
MPAAVPTSPHLPRIALVTGAGSGIGRATALALWRQGWTVVLTGRRLETLQATLDLARTELDVDLSERSLLVSADVTDEAAVAGLFETIRLRFGRLDLLFNNAGLFTQGVSIEDLSLQAWRASVDTNLTGVFLCTREAFRLMKAQQPQGGRIVNNGSISAHAPRPGSVAYTSTKHAITGLTRTAALDGRAWNIAVGQIDIGNAASDMTAAMTAGIRQADGSLRVEPVMDVCHAADAVAHMAGLPLSANVLFMTVMATAMPFVGRG